MVEHKLLRRRAADTMGVLDLKFSRKRNRGIRGSLHVSTSPKHTQRQLFKSSTETRCITAYQNILHSTVTSAPSPLLTSLALRSFFPRTRI
jgi:hypothetical protein